MYIPSISHYFYIPCLKYSGVRYIAANRIYQTVSSLSGIDFLKNVMHERDIISQKDL